MGGFPALMIQQPESPLKQFAEAEQIKAGLQQQQMGEIELQNARQAQQENAIIRQSYKNNAGDMQAVIRDAAASGKVNPGTMLKLQNSYIDQQTAVAKLSETQIANAQKMGDFLSGGLDAVMKVPVEQRPQELRNQLAGLAARGVDISKVLPTIQGLPDLSDDTLKGVEASLLGHNKMLENELAMRKTQAEVDTAAARKSQAQTSAAHLQAELPGGPLADVGKAEMADWLKKNPGKGPADYEKWKASLAPQAGIAAQGQPSSAMAQAVANGQLKIQDVLTPRMPLPLRQSFLNEVMQINPNFKSYDYDIEKGVMKSATSGKIGDNLTAFNTAIEHSKQLQVAAAALDNTDLRSYNKLANALDVELGSDKVTNFNVIKNALAGEMSKVFKGGQATDAEIKAVEQPFHDANSPKQLMGAINSAIKLMNSKRDALKAQVEKGQKGQANFGEEPAKNDFFGQFGGKPR